MDGRNYDIAVVGESMAGKSTWISALCREDVAEMLGEIHRENKQGQTKVAAHYLLRDTKAESFYVESVKWNYEKLIDCLEKGQKEEVEKLFAPLGLSLEKFFGESCQDKDMEVELREYLESGEAIKCIGKSQNLSEFVKNVVNDKTFGDSGLISCIEISVPAAPEVWKEISDRGLDYVRIRDTRGFLDESTERMQEFLEKVKKEQAKREDDGRDALDEETDPQEECIQEMLDERGISGTDAVIFMSVSNSNALCKEGMRETYGPMIAYLLGKHPVFLMVRTDEMTKLIRQKGRTYQENCNWILKDEIFSDLDDVRELLEDYRKRSDGQNDYKSDIAKKNYRELLLVNLSKKMMQENRNWDKEIYRPCVSAVFGEVMEGIRHYHESLETARRCLEVIANPTAKLKELYDTYFWKNILCYNFREPKDKYYYSGLFGFRTRELAEKLRGSYLGGMVGKRGGLTTYIPGGMIRVGEYAIDMLETVYSLEKYLLNELVEELEPELEKYVSQKVEEDRVSEAVREEKENLRKYFEHLREMNFERLSCTNRMVPRIYLEKVCKDTKKYYEKKCLGLGESFPELRERCAEDVQERDREALAVVNYGVWKLMISHLYLDDTEEDNG